MKSGHGLLNIMLQCNPTKLMLKCCATLTY